MIYIVYIHISSFYIYLYHIVVNIEAPEIQTSTKEKLSECVRKACEKKNMAESVCNMAKKTGDKLKPFLAQGVDIQEDKLVNLVKDIEEHQKSMEIAEREMRESTSAFMVAHGTTLEVLGEAGKIKYKEKFRRKVSKDVSYIFCSMQFQSTKLWTKHIIDCHWGIFKDTVSICFTC